MPTRTEYIVNDGIKYKACPNCKEVKQVSTGYYQSKYNKTGHDSFCKTCQRLRIKAIMHRKRQDIKFRISEVIKKGKFDLTQVSYTKLLEQQGYKCAICGKEETAKRKDRQNIRSLSIDHCHRTGKIRGLLCLKCNSTLGRIENLITRKQLPKYIQYLLRSFKV